MECNKDEARRAMDIAERKVTEKDYNGAKKFASKAQNLYPHLDGLKQLLMTIDVYISGERKISGETDWYGVLGVDPLADDEAVRKQYRKLALLLHPDKNKCKGAEGAFKLLSEAWSLLSDKANRQLYNTKRQGTEVQRSSSATQSGVPVPPQQPASNGAQNVKVPLPPKQPASNGVQNARVPPIVKAKTKPPVRMDRSRMDSPAFASSSSQKESSTFWTKCERCRTQFEYLRVYLNQTLLCPNCREGFVAAEKSPPESVVKPVNLSSNKQHRSSKNQATNKNSVGREPSPAASHSFVWDSSSRTGGSNSRDATNQVQQGLKRGFGESQERDAAREFTNSDLSSFKKPKTNDTYNFGPFAPNSKWSDQIRVGMESRFGNSARGNTETPNTIGSRHPHIQGMLLPYHITKSLVKKAQLGILKSVSEIEEKERAVEREKKSLKATSKMSSKGIEVEKDSRPMSHDQDKKGKSIIVPDSDFHIFDLDRCESSFEEDQIWAAYDDDDGMPRFYARIQKVISVNPFKMKISWLNSKSCSEFAPLDWRGAGFAKTCGDFRTGRYETTDTLNAFSHKVDFSKGGRGIIQILPKKGQVWALYRNWSPEWDKDTPDEVIHQYDMVEVLDDYTGSVTVVLLVKAQGFGSVYLRSTDESDVRKISKEEMFRFSHQVPHCILSGEEAEDAPVGCLELDPAATPIKLLSGEGEAAESSKVGNGENSEEMAMNVD